MAVMKKSNNRSFPEIWGGLECTVNRIKDHYFDQVEKTGHTLRIDDLDRFFQLGIRTIRYPLLWERVAPSKDDLPDWGWADTRMQYLSKLGMQPIVGLLHHGSGPSYTNLLDPDFPDLFAEYALTVAKRYPWVQDYTPINEPLTTARFSGLYGIWYPHQSDDHSFSLALINQVKGIQQAMKAIHSVNPSARLIQTEDLAKTSSTPSLTYQAEYDNLRRWLSIDLLCGAVDPTHPLYDYLLWAGIEPVDLDEIRTNRCPPDILGFNYYITGERYLDDRCERYPADLVQGNGRQAYADVEVVRVCEDGIDGPARLLNEAWERYHLPLALTEVHLGSTREEQLRWLMDIWNDILGLQEQGIDFRAFSVWALLGMYNWNSLLTRDDDTYEPGIFDLRSSPPRETLLAQAVRSLTSTGSFDHPVLDGPGWWQRQIRFAYPTTQRDLEENHRTARGMRQRGRTNPRLIAVTGSRGTLGAGFLKICEQRGLAVRGLSKTDMDITDPDSIGQKLMEIKPWAVINTAGYVRVDDAEREIEQCKRINAYGAGQLDFCCREMGIRFVTFSTDLVFDGQQNHPYMESSQAHPLNVYGASKAEAEKIVLNQDPYALVIRTSAFFGPWDYANFLIHCIRALSSGLTVRASDDIKVSPTYVPELVQATLDLLLDGEHGIWHLANQGEISWFELALQAARIANLPVQGIENHPAEELGQTARRPAYSVLGSEKGNLMKPLDSALERFVTEANFLQ